MARVMTLSLKKLYWVAKSLIPDLYIHGKLRSWENQIRRL